jgi:tripartite-type tricarboxylate transporter receptor subunit TctC
MDVPGETAASDFSRRSALRCLGLLAALAFAPVVSTAEAQEYPSREIRAICNFAPGAGGDVYVRFFSDRLSRASGNPVIVENRPGANGNIATEVAAKARPDGYTIFITPANSTLAAAMHLFKTLAFDPVKDFVPVTTLAQLVFAFAVDVRSPIKTIAELTAALKAKSRNGFYGVGNNPSLVSAALYKAQAGLASTHVNYVASGTALNDLIGGNLDFIVYDSTFLSNQARGGKVRILATTGPRRPPALNDIPTMAESGFAGFDVTSWWAVFVPAGTPQPIVTKLAKWFDAIVAEEDTRTFLYPLGGEPLPGSAELATSKLKTDIERWGEFVKLAKIEPQ